MNGYFRIYFTLHVLVPNYPLQETYIEEQLLASKSVI